jgi:hypothetical protein
MEITKHLFGEDEKHHQLSKCYYCLRWVWKLQILGQIVVGIHDLQKKIKLVIG